jgi:uncharacterized protein YjbI with pentapeptide repeats
MILETRTCPKCQTEMFSSARFCVKCGNRLDAPLTPEADGKAANIFTAGLTPRATPAPIVTAVETSVEEIDQGFESVAPDDDAPSIDVTPGARTAERVAERAEPRRSHEMAEYSKDEVLRRVRNKQGLKRAGLSGIDLNGAALEGVDFGRAELDGANLANAKLSKAILRSANLRGAILTGADLAGADLARADLAGAKLAGAKLAGANLSHADLSDADLTGADLGDAKLEGATLDGAVLAGAMLAGTGLDRPQRVESATRYFGKGDVLRDATLEFGDGSVIHVDSRFENCSIALGEGAELTIGEPGVLKNCAIVGRGSIVVHGRFFERSSPGIVGPKSLVVSTGGAVVGSIEQTIEPTAFAFEPGCRLRVKILKPRQPLAAE